MDGRSTAPGTGGRARIAGRDVSGKTGTAQVISNEGQGAAARQDGLDLRDNGWFVFFAPRDNPQIAGVVFVEHGGHGGATAAPIAKHVLETFFAKQDGQPLPALEPAGARHRPRRRRQPPSAGPPAATPAPPDRGTLGTGHVGDRRSPPLPHLDWPLIAAVLGADAHRPGDDLQRHVGLPHEPARAREFWTQVYALPVGLAALAVCLLDRLPHARAAVAAPLRRARRWRSSPSRSSASSRGGARRWIAARRLQRCSRRSSRASRVALVLAMFYGEQPAQRARSIGELVDRRGCSSRVPFLLIAKQPDLGTAATLAAGVSRRRSTSPACGCAGWRSRAIVARAALAGDLAATACRTIRSERIETFLDPSKDPRGAGYQQIQAKVTVGSGGLLGKGFRQGTQGGYGFLPVAHNDFVFSVLAEEHGFLGVLVALGLYLFVILRSLDAAKLAKDRVGAFLVVAIISGFGFQVLYNITMSAGLAPVKGLTLPLMSYGGSSLVATLAGFGLILNVRMRRFTN